MDIKEYLNIDSNFEMDQEGIIREKAFSRPARGKRKMLSLLSGQKRRRITVIL